MKTIIIAATIWFASSIFGITNKAEAQINSAKQLSNEVAVLEEVISAREYLLPSDSERVNNYFDYSSAMTIDVDDKVGCIGSVPVQTLSQINNRLHFPAHFSEEERGVVVVEFTYDDKGYIRVKNYNGSNEGLCNYVTSELEQFRLTDGAIVPGKEYLVKISFKRI